MAEHGERVQIVPRNGRWDVMVDGRSVPPSAGFASEEQARDVADSWKARLRSPVKLPKESDH